MKNNSNKDYSQFKKIAETINLLLKAGEWNGLSKEKKIFLKSSLGLYYSKVKTLFSKNKLAKVLGAAILLISSNSMAQTFAPVVVNPFNIKVALDNYLHNPDFADIDNDGDLDLFTSRSYGEVFLFQENIGTATIPIFADTIPNPFGLESGTKPLSPFLGDIDNDGDLDILASSLEGDGIIFYENSGTIDSPAFEPVVLTPFGIEAVEYIFMTDLVDIDNDGDLDIFTTGYNDETDHTTIFYIENIGSVSSPEFAAAVIDPFGINLPDTDEYVSFVDFADLDWDGDLDMIRTQFYGEVIYYHENIGTATEPDFISGAGEEFPFDLALSAYTYIVAPTLVDIDADGDFDLFLSEYYGDVLYYENREVVLSTKENSATLNFEIYPNPATNSLYINTDLNNFSTINIISLDGKKVYSSEKSPNSEIDVTNLDSGIYWIELISNDGIKTQQKFIKE